MQTLYCVGPSEDVVRLDETTETSNLIDVLEEIAAELGWQAGSQMRDSRSHSVHIAAVADGEIVGGLQVVPATEDKPLPCWSIWPETAEPCRADIAHVTIMALRKEYRGSAGLFWPLCVELWRWCEANGIREIWHEVTPGTMRLYQRLGWPLEIVGGLRPHWGENCFLCRMEVARVAGMMVMKAMHSASYQTIVRMMSRSLETLQKVA